MMVASQLTTPLGDQNLSDIEVAMPKDDYLEFEESKGSREHDGFENIDEGEVTQKLEYLSDNTGFTSRSKGIFQR